MSAASERFLMLFAHCDRHAASRAPWTAGRSSATSMPMIAITTRSSTRENAAILRLRQPKFNGLSIDAPPAVTTASYGQLISCGLPRCHTFCCDNRTAVVVPKRSPGLRYHPSPESDLLEKYWPRLWRAFARISHSFPVFILEVIGT